MMRSQERLFLLCAGALRLPPVAAVLRREHVPALIAVEVTLGPAEVVTVFDAGKEFRGQLGVLLLGVQLRPVDAQMVPSVQRRIQSSVCLVHRQRDDVAGAGGVPLGGLECLAGLVGVISPDAGV